jgi:choline dehydrogenase-like flavoprotein
MRLRDAREVPEGHRIEADLCIIGAGAAGLALAHALRAAAPRVVVLESGGPEPDAATQALCEGSLLGIEDFPLQASRLRGLGGTTNHWTAWVHPLDAADLEKRAWVPHSGWPLRFSELAPYYARARRFFELPERAFDPAAWEQGEELRAWRFAGDAVASRIVQIVPPERRRLGQTLRAALEAAPNVEVYLHASVLEIVADREQRRIEHLAVRTPEGRSFTARARGYVLAAGGIENARLLLLSTGASPAGLGNDHDLVGRFFQNHPEQARAVDLLATPRAPSAAFYAMRRSGASLIVGSLVLSERVQRQEQLQNCSFRIERTLPLRPRGAGAGLGLAANALDADVRRVAFDADGPRPEGGPRAEAEAERAPAVHWLRLHAEPAPNRESRVRLGDHRDAFGQRRVVLDWRLAPGDSQAVRRTLEVLARAWGASGFGRARSRFPAAGFAGFNPRGSFHHMGTTRMHDDPKQGVVDREGRVHGVANLWVAGSSVFPTYGTVNPTLTIVALTLRLADHLRGVLR